MENLYGSLLGISVVVSFLLIIYVKRKIKEYRENKMFWKSVEKMQKEHNRNFSEAFKKALEESTPLIIEFIKKKLETEKCKFEINNCCYAYVCYSNKKCSAKNEFGHVVCMATVEEIKELNRLNKKD